MTDLINHKTVITSLHSYVYDPERSDQVRLKTCMHGVPTATVLIHSSSKSSKRYTSVHPFSTAYPELGHKGSSLSTPFPPFFPPFPSHLLHLPRQAERDVLRTLRPGGILIRCPDHLNNRLLSICAIYFFQKLN